MSGENAKVKAHYLMVESTFGTVPDSTGAAALFVPAMVDDGVFIKNENQYLPRNFANARNTEKPGRKGRGKASLSLKGLLCGYTASTLTNGSAPPTKQWFDYVLEAFLGTAQAHNAVTVGTGSTTSSLVTSANSLAAGDLACIRGGSTNSGYAQWARAQQATSPYTLSPVLAAAPVNGDIVAASRMYYPRVGTNQTSQIGGTFSWVSDVDGAQHVMPGARPSSFSLSGKAGEPIEWSLGLMADYRQLQSFGSLPSVPLTDPTPMIFRLNSALINGTAYDVASFTLDFNITVSEVQASGGTNGRSNYRVMSVFPRLKLDPLYSTAFQTLFDNDTMFEVGLQLGDGALANSQLNTWYIHFEGARLAEPANEANDNGVVRKSLVIHPVDMALTGYQSFPFQIGIA